MELGIYRAKESQTIEEWIGDLEQRIVDLEYEMVRLKRKIDHIGWLDEIRRKMKKLDDIGLLFIWVTVVIFLVTDIIGSYLFSFPLKTLH